jgi:hypothetical protein
VYLAGTRVNDWDLIFGGGSWGGRAEGKRGGAAVSDSTAKQGKGRE